MVFVGFPSKIQLITGSAMKSSARFRSPQPVETLPEAPARLPLNNPFFNDLDVDP
jgi:hypothetical protein